LRKKSVLFILAGDGRYSRGVVYAGEDVLESKLFDGFKINMKEVFPRRDTTGSGD